jgi:signal transduction histidine kinase
MRHGDKPRAQEMRSHTTDDAAKRRPSGGTDQRSPLELSGPVTHRFALVGQMTGGIAHDFKNILAVIDSSLRLAETHSNDPGLACTFISGAREGVARGLALTSQLFDFTNQRDFQACSANANELLKTIEVFLRYGAGSEVRVLLALSPNIPNCLIDPSQFNAAVLNLVLNARDAMAQGGEIQISTELCVIQPDDSDITPRSYVRVRVKDNGSGMPDAVLEKIFEPFFTTKGENGTGLGIPQGATFIRDLGGDVCVASEVGRGTTFDMLFPTVQQNRTPIETSFAAAIPSVGDLSAA